MDQFFNTSDALMASAFKSSDTAGKMLGWNLPPRDLDLLIPHWQQFEAVPFYYHLILAMVYFILMIVSLTGNGIVVWIFSSTKSLRSPSNLFILNLAIFDLCMMLEMPILIVNSYHQRMVGGATMCKWYAVLGSVSGIGGAATNAVIAYDRYKTISSPLDGRIKYGKAILLILITWFWAFPYTIFPALDIWGRFVPEGFLTTCSFDFLTPDADTKMFVASIFSWAYCMPLCLIIFFYTLLFKHVRAHEESMRKQAEKMNVKSLSANKDASAESVEIRIAKAAFTIFFMFLCAWTPYGIVAMIGAFGNRQLLTPVATMIPAVAAKIVSCIDPWIYAISHPRYRKALEERVPWLGITEKMNEVKSDTASDATTAASA